jgi:peptide/nickel transport system permease protein
VARVVTRRLLVAVPMLFGMSIVVFAILRLAPGDPVRAILGTQATPQLIASMRADLGLDDPIYSQYLSWIGGILTGDFGTDFRTSDSIGTMLMDRLPVTLELSVLALVLAVVVAIPLGTLAAVRRGRVPDRAAQGVSMLGVSVPDFWLGIMLVLVFSLSLGMLPSSGWVPFSEDPVENLRHLILPAVSLAAGLAAVLIRLTRSAMLEALQQDYIRFCRMKGVPERSIVVKHALRNAAVPIVTVIGMQAGYLLGGAIVIEQIFSLPGVGRLVLDSVLQRNYPVVQSSVLVIGLMFIVANLLADVAYAVINPRLRAAGS